MKRLLGCLIAFVLCHLPLQAIDSRVQEGSVLDVRGAYFQLDEESYLNVRIIDRRIAVFFLNQDLQIQKVPDVRMSIRFSGAAGKRSQGSGTRIIMRDDSGLFFTHPQNIRAPWDFWIEPIILFPDESSLVLPRTRLRQAQGTDTFEIEDDIPGAK
jgi:hypothetical protein